MFHSPFEKIKKATEKKITFSLFYILIISLIVMRYFDRFLVNEISPYGIVSFELAGTLDNAVAIINSWSELSRTYAGLSLGYDFLFLLIYTLFISLMIHKLNQRLWFKKPFYRIGELLIWSMFLTAIFDTVENVSLIKLLVGARQQFWVSVAYCFAIAKFLLIIISILYIIINSFLLLTKRKS
jgi:ABC-type transport system involved in cytochrome c biogenesis permease subunit